MAFAITLVVLLGTASVASARMQGAQADLGFDVIFIVDNSNSMNWRDRDRLAIEAVTQFIDLSFITGLDSRAGFVMYSDHRIIRGHTNLPLTDISIEAGADFVVSRMMPVPSQGYGDIGWGFLAAAHLMADGEVLDGFDPNITLVTANDLIAAQRDHGRQQVVIFLSDGTIQLRDRLIGGAMAPYPEDMYPRNEGLSRRDVDDVLQVFLDAGIRVHTLAFDYYVEWPPHIPPELTRYIVHDPEFLEYISTTTGGLFFRIDEGPEQLIPALQDIWAMELTGVAIGGDADQPGAGFINVPEVGTGIGDPIRTFPFSVPNESIFEAILTIRSDEPLTMEQLSLFSPAGVPVDIAHPASNMVFFQRGQNTVLSMRRPETGNIQSGNWTLNILDAEDAELLAVRMLYYYDMALHFAINPARPVQGDYVTISAQLASPETGQAHQRDLNLFAEANLTLHITDPDGGTSTHNFSTGEFVAGGLTPGTHILRATMDVTGALQSSEPFELNIAVYPIELAQNTLDVTLHYGGIFGLGGQRRVDLAGLLTSYFPGSRFTAEPDHRNWENVFTMEINEDRSEMVLATVDGEGAADVHITISNQWGATARVLLNVEVSSWWTSFGIWFWIILAVAILVLLFPAVIVWRKIWGAKPSFGNLRDEITIDMPSIPYSIGTAEDLNISSFEMAFARKFMSASFPKNRSKVSLYNMLRYHSSDGNPYIAAFERAKAKDFIQGIMFVAKRTGSKIIVSMEIPASKHGLVLLNEEEVPKSGRKMELTHYNGEPTVKLQINPNDTDETFEIIFSIDEYAGESGL